MNKPPLGLRPRFIVLELRLKEIHEAILRYAEARYGVPKEWIKEQCEILKELETSEYSNNKD